MNKLKIEWNKVIWLFGFTFLNYFSRLFTAFMFGEFLELPYKWSKILWFIPRVDFSLVDKSLFKSISTISLLVPGLIFFLIFMFVGYLVWKKESYCKDLWKLNLLVVFLFVTLLQYFLAIVIDYRVEYATYYYGFFIIALAWIYAWFGYTRIRKRCNNLEN